MKLQQKKQIAAAIEKEIAHKDMSQNAWADEHGISRSHMSNIRNQENWHKVGQRTWDKLSDAVSATINSSSIQETSNLLTIQTACRDAQKHNRTVAIAAYTGAGKTTSLMDYASLNPNTYYVACRSSFGTKDMAMRIAQTMGVQAKGGRAIDLEDAIIERLRNSPQSLLILDSVSKLRKDAALQFIGDLMEYTEHRAGIVLAGTEFLQDYITKQVERNKRGFRELNRRVYAWVRLPAFHSNEVQVEAKQLCQQQGIWEEKKIKHILNKSTCFGSLINSIDRMKKAVKR